MTTHDSDHHATPSPAAGSDIFSAIGDGVLERVKRILEAGHVNINCRGRNSWTPVIVATLHGHRDLVKFLVGRGADVPLVISGGNNTLHVGCYYNGDLMIVKLILSVVDVNVRNNNGKTVTDTARIYGRQRVVKLLVSHGAH
ncbi:sex-determining protein fem-1-like [Haliotis asinina]|uniref:sex-determining protein fem-1-like n=1 Tax=Haliotis asinina TaxID=109174 RepID=UPI0035322F96